VQDELRGLRAKYEEIVRRSKELQRVNHKEEEENLERMKYETGEALSLMYLQS
jgi:hypothetical protein